MLHKIAKVAAMLLAVAIASADERPPEPLDLDEALARQSASDLISAAASAYDCSMAQRSFRKLGTKEETIYMIEVSMEGPECEDAMLLLARHGSIRDFVFRAWQPPTDIEGMDPLESPPANPIGPDDPIERQ